MNAISQLVRKHALLIFFSSSLLYPFLLINPDHFPYTGFALFFASLATIVIVFKQKKNIYDSLIYVGIILLSSFFILRANENLLFLNTLAIFYLGSFLILPHDEQAKLFDVILSPFIAFFNILKKETTFVYRVPNYFKKDISKDARIEEHVPAIIISGIIVLITVPLLASANPFFNNLVKSLLDLFNLQIWIDKIFGRYPIVQLFRVLVFLFFLFILPKLASLLVSDEPKTANRSLFAINFTIPKVVLSVILLIFFFTQAQLYFADTQTLQKIGYTNSKYAREVFGQLSVVAVIIFFLVYSDRKRTKLASLLTNILVVEAFFLTGIALKSVYDYTSAFGFTHKRLYGYAMVIWIFGVFSMFLYHYHKNLSHLSLIRKLVVYSVVVLLGINLANFDYIIYHYAKARTGEGVDYYFLSGLSPDSHSYKQQLEILTEGIDKHNYLNNPKQVNLSHAYYITHKIENLQRKYKSDYSPLTFNYSEYQEFQSVKDIDIYTLRQKIDNIQSRLSELQQGLPQPPTTIENDDFIDQVVTQAPPKSIPATQSAPESMKVEIITP